MAQNPPQSEIFLFDLNVGKDSLEVKNGKNISQNMGYNNQPAFFSNDLLIYSKNRSGQTDIASYDLKNGEHTWHSNTTSGSEYSPGRIPGKEEIAAVRLDTTGLQRLYQYDVHSMSNSLLVPDLKIGYFAFFNSEILLSTVLTEQGMDLVLINLSDNTRKPLASNAGRSVHRVPNSNSMSYTVSNEEGKQDLYLLDLNNEEPSSFFVCTLPAGVQDYTWLDRDRILIGKGEKLYLYDNFGTTEWIPVADLSNFGLKNITRLAVNEAGSKIALAAYAATP